MYPVCVIDTDMGGLNCESNDRCTAVEQVLFQCSTSVPYKKWTANFSQMDGWVAYPPELNKYLLKKAAEK